MRPTARTLPALIPALLLALFATGCDEDDAVSIRLRVEDDFSGEVRTSSLAMPAAPGAVTREIGGVRWDSEVAVVAAAGTFGSLSELALADLSLQAGRAEDGMRFLRISIPRGPETRWPAAFVPLDGGQRTRAAAALDPSGRAKDIGANLKLEVDLPDAVVGNGVSNRARGVRAKAEGDVATLLVPLEVGRTPGDAIVWHLTWQAD